MFTPPKLRLCDRSPSRTKPPGGSSNEGPTVTSDHAIGANLSLTVLDTRVAEAADAKPVSRASKFGQWIRPESLKGAGAPAGNARGNNLGQSVVQPGRAGLRTRRVVSQPVEHPLGVEVGKAVSQMPVWAASMGRTPFTTFPAVSHSPSSSPSSRRVSSVRTRRPWDRSESRTASDVRRAQYQLGLPRPWRRGGPAKSGHAPRLLRRRPGRMR